MKLVSHTARKAGTGVNLLDPYRKPDTVSEAVA